MSVALTASLALRQTLVQVAAERGVGGVVVVGGDGVLS